MIESLPLGLATGIVLALVVVSFLSGIGITTIGPGGIFLTIALYSLTMLPSGVIAGTVQVAFIVTGLVGSVAYVRSGEISGENTLQILLLCGGSIGGALFGSWTNGFVSRDLFGILLGVLAGLVGIVIVYRQRRSLPAIIVVEAETTTGKAMYVGLGFVLGAFSGLLGVGGPVLAVPALVVLGVPMLSALAAAQVQSIFIACFAAAGYFVQGTVSLPLAVLIGAPLVGGVVLGWKVAHHVNPDKLKSGLGIVLVLISPFLAL